MRRLLCAFAAVLVLPTLALAKGGLDRDVHAYAQKHGFKTRVVKLNVPGRNVSRIVVPVTPASYNDFIAGMTANQNALVIHYKDLEPEHPVPFIAPGKGWTAHSMANIGGQNRQTDPMAFINTYQGGQAKEFGRLVTLELEPGQRTYLANHWNTVVQGPNNRRSGCMWWFVHAEVDNGKSLAHALGITRSGASSNFLKKMLHAGDEHVAVVGLMVPTLEAFNAKTDAELLGAPPAGGAMEAIRD